MLGVPFISPPVLPQTPSVVVDVLPLQTANPKTSKRRREEGSTTSGGGESYHSASEIVHAEEECAQQRRETLQTYYEDAFREISVATGISNIDDELVKAFLENVEHNFSYLNERLKDGGSNTGAAGRDVACCMEDSNDMDGRWTNNGAHGKN